MNGNLIEVSGTGAWKLLQVADATTGELIIEKKFYKADFDQVIQDPRYSPYIDALLECAMVKKMSTDANIDIDAESYEEVRSIAMGLSDELIDPEA